MPSIHPVAVIAQQLVTGHLDDAPSRQKRSRNPRRREEDS